MMTRHCYKPCCLLCLTPQGVTTSPWQPPTPGGGRSLPTPDTRSPCRSNCSPNRSTVKKPFRKTAGPSRRSPGKRPQSGRWPLYSAAVQDSDKLDSPLTILKNIAPLLDDQIAVLRSRHRKTYKNQKRLERLDTILKIARRWSKNREMEPLLLEMAEAATHLLAADRASIFLWDRENRTLVGRPALGVEGNELRIADNVGLVGRVIKSGKPQRANIAIEPDLFDKQVDDRLGYQTKTLLCVPLRDAAGVLFGAFEVINKIAGSFNDDDEEALAELADQAAITLEAAKDRRPTDRR